MPRDYFKIIRRRLRQLIAPTATPPAEPQLVEEGQEPVAEQTTRVRPPTHSKPVQDVLDQLAADPSLAPSLLEHLNGYVRQAAVEALVAPLPDTASFRVLALRLNDWVPEVRAAAERAFASINLSASQEQIDAVAGLFLTPNPNWHRMNGTGLRAVRALVDRPGAKARAEERLIGRLETSSEGGLARELRSWLQHDWIDPYLLRLAQNAVQPSVRKSAYEALIYGEARRWVGVRTVEEQKYAIIKTRSIYDIRKLTIDVDVEALVRQGLSDRFAVVRWIAAGGLVDNIVELPEIAEIIPRLLNDKSIKVRERGEFLSRRHGITP